MAEMKRVFQTCSRGRCGHVQAVTLWDGKTMWKCSMCGMLQELKTARDYDEF